MEFLVYIRPATLMDRNGNSRRGWIHYRRTDVRYAARSVAFYKEEGGGFENSVPKEFQELNRNADAVTVSNAEWRSLAKGS